MQLLQPSLKYQKLIFHPLSQSLSNFLINKTQKEISPTITDMEYKLVILYT